jgi:thiosulfate/3-mercaptopyruvate sulfurtransferase
MFSIISVIALGLASEGYPNTKLLVEIETLAKANAQTEFVIVDGRDKEKYLQGHIPGAVWVDLAAWSKIVTATPNDPEWPSRLAESGIDPSRPVVVYSDDIKEAARLWWILRYSGISDVRLLNGTFSHWETEKQSIEKKENHPTVKLANIKLVQETHASKEDVLHALKDKKNQILDARSTKEFCGELKTTARSGAIPDAIHLEWNQFIDPKTKKFKSTEEIKQLIDANKIDLDRPIVTYCQSGGRASVVAFGMELMGGKQVRNYYRSWSEWGNDKDTPIEKGKK